MKLIHLPEIQAALDENEAMDAIAQAFVRLHRGRAALTSVGYLRFADADGDCHIKSGWLVDDGEFVVKVATGFYRNPALGLPSSNGFMAVLSARTGEVLAILDDQGWLTDMRTALTAAIAAAAIRPEGARTVGVVGAGRQAQLQARIVAGKLGASEVLLWARDARKAQAVAQQVGAVPVELDELCARADLVLTTTPSTQPLLDQRLITSGMRIVASGADAPGKRELDLSGVPALQFVVDATEQCVDHGEASWVIADGQLKAGDLMELGALLDDPRPLQADAVVVADLTGVAVQDVAIARCVWSSIKAHL
jgi:ornithine cyclodeaminase